MTLHRTPSARRCGTLAAALVAIVFLAVSARALAANLLPGSGFDAPDDLTMHWGNLGPGKVWSSEDRLGSDSSGSLLMINGEDPGTGILLFSSCVPVVAGNAYDFGGWSYIPFLQPADGFAQVRIQWRETCPAGAFTGSEVAATSTTIGEWTLVEGEAEAPVGAGGARLALSNGKTSGAEGIGFEVYFDDVFLPEPGGAGSATGAFLALAALRRRARPRE